MNVISYHIEYDLPIDLDKDDTEIVKTLAGYIEYIMDDIIHDLGKERYQLLFYYLTDVVVANKMQTLVYKDIEELKRMIRSVEEESR